MNWKYFLHDFRWRIFKARFPEKGYGEYYSEFIASKISSGNTHPTLSAEPSDTEHYRKATEERVAFLKDQGLEPRDRFIDYGCGALRIGRVLIDFLDEGNYLGLDITPLFYEGAFTALGDGLKGKKPQVLTINEESLSRAGDFKADMVYVGGVLHHVPPSEVEAVVKAISSVLVEGGVGFVTMRSGKTKRLGLMRWAHEEEKVLKYFEACGVSGEVFPDPVPPVTDAGSTNIIFRVERKAAK